jgi:hypothetical protein
MNALIAMLMIFAFAVVVCVPIVLIIDKYFNWYSWFNINDDDE